MKKKKILIISVIFLILILIVIGICFNKNFAAKNRELYTQESVVFDNSGYYPNYLPFISKNVESSPIEIPNGVIDPSNYTELIATGFHNDYLPPGNRLYIVQYKKGRTLENYMDLRPARVLSDNAYVLALSMDELKKLVADPEINFVANYHPHYKLHKDVSDAYYNLKITPKTKLVLTFTPFAQPIEIQGILKRQSLGAVVTSQAGQNYTINGITDRDQLFEYASNPLITEIRFAN